jgi:hypothetical protein
VAGQIGLSIRGGRRLRRRAAAMKLNLVAGECVDVRSWAREIIYSAAEEIVR